LLQEPSRENNFCHDFDGCAGGATGHLVDENEQMMRGMWLLPSCFLLAYTELHVSVILFSFASIYLNLFNFDRMAIIFLINGTLISTGNHSLFIWITLAFDHAKVTLLRCHGLLTGNNRVRMPLLPTFPMQQQEALTQ
jgi:hypothetical protein